MSDSEATGDLVPRTSVDDSFHEDMEVDVEAKIKGDVSTFVRLQ